VQLNYSQIDSPMTEAIVRDSFSSATLPGVERALGIDLENLIAAIADPDAS
jgi:hypothetical protein